MSGRWDRTPASIGLAGEIAFLRTDPDNSGHFHRFGPSAGGEGTVGATGWDWRVQDMIGEWNRGWKGASVSNVGVKE